MNTLFSDVSFAHGMDALYQRKTLETKVACLGRSINWKYGHQVALPPRRAYAPTGNTASFDDQEKSNSWILISTVLRLAALRVTEQYLTIRLRPRVFYEQIVNEAQPR